MTIGTIRKESTWQFRNQHHKKKTIRMNFDFQTLHVKTVYTHVGKPIGDAEVSFANEADAKKAMTKHKQNLQHRYIELFDVGPVKSPSKSMIENFDTYS